MTRDTIIKLAREADAAHDNVQVTPFLERFAALIAATEREACAKACESRMVITPDWQLDQHYNQAASHCAAAIRARSNHG